MSSANNVNIYTHKVEQRRKHEHFASDKLKLLLICIYSTLFAVDVRGVLMLAFWALILAKRCSIRVHKFKLQMEWMISIKVKKIDSLEKRWSKQEYFENFC